MQFPSKNTPFEHKQSGEVAPLLEQLEQVISEVHSEHLLLQGAHSLWLFRKLPLGQVSKHYFPLKRKYPLSHSSQSA